MKQHPQRAHPRFQVLLPVEVAAERVGRRQATLHDVSLGGAYLEDFPLSSVGKEITIFFLLPDGSEAGIEAEVRNVRIEGGSIQGMGICWLNQTDEARAFLTELVAKAQVASTHLPRLSEASRLRFIIEALTVLGWYGVCLAIGPMFGGVRWLHLPRPLQWGIGALSAFLVLVNLAIALRRRGKVGLRGRGNYDVWVGFHVLLILAGLLVSGIHVAGRRGGGIAMACALSVALLSITGLPGLWFWKRKANTDLEVTIRRHWLKVHVAMIGPFLLSLGWHVFQVVRF